MQDRNVTEAEPAFEIEGEYSSILETKYAQFTILGGSAEVQGLSHVHIHLIDSGPFEDVLRAGSNRFERIELVGRERGIPEDFAGIVIYNGNYPCYPPLLFLCDR